MKQAKFSVHEAQVSFLDEHAMYGFKDKSSMVRSALAHLKEKLDAQQLKESADLYAEIYEESAELQDLARTGTLEWPQ